jgi:hypothetical protein
VNKILGRSLLVAILSALAFGFVAAEPRTASAKEFICPPTRIATETLTEKLVVPPESGCHILLSTVLKNVEVGEGAFLLLYITEVRGNIQLGASSLLQLEDAHIFGNVECDDGASVALYGNSAIHGKIDEGCFIT